jgi:alkyl hydroperoxide reductase subunit AhpC
VKRLEGKPFALIGVNTDEDRSMVKNRNQQDQVNWRSFYDKSPIGPICSAWSVNSFPTIYVIDHKGIIRFINVRGEEIDRAVEQLLGDMEKVRKK